MTWLQHWTDALFLHFAVSPGQLAQRVPSDLEIDTFEGQAWLSYVFFRLKLRPAGLPYLPGLSSLLELNVRTYVRYRGQAGIVFLRMYADNWLAIRAAQLLTPLCYEAAAMRADRSSGAAQHIACIPARRGDGELSVDFDVACGAQEPSSTSLDAWLLERYRLFVPMRAGLLLAAEVEHAPWRVSPVRIEAIRQTLDQGLGMALPSLSFAHHSPGVTAKFAAFHAPGSLALPSLAAVTCR